MRCTRIIRLCRDNILNLMVMPAAGTCPAAGTHSAGPIAFTKNNRREFCKTGDQVSADVHCERHRRECSHDQQDGPRAG